MTDMWVVGQVGEDPDLRYEYLTGMHQLSEAPPNTPGDRIDILILNDGGGPGKAAFYVEGTGGFGRAVPNVAVGPGAYELKYAFPEGWFGHYWVRIRASSPFMLPTVRFLRRDIQHRPASDQVYGPEAFARFERTRTEAVIGVKRTRIW
jgi:hypothetical protein